MRQDQHIENAALSLGGWTEEQRAHRDYANKTAALPGVFSQRLDSVSNKGRSPGATHVQRAIMVKHKQGILKHALAQKLKLTPTPLRLDPTDNQSAFEHTDQVLDRLEGGLQQLKMSTRELLIVAHAQRDALRAQRGAGAIRADEFRDLEAKLTSAIDKLFDLDGKIHDTADILDQARQMEVDGKSDREIHRFLEKQFGISDASSPFANVVDAPNDPRRLHVAMASAAGDLTTAWANEPNFLRDLGSSATIANAVGQEEPDADYRQHAQQIALKTYADVDNGRVRANGSPEHAFFQQIQKTGLAAEFEARCRTQLSTSTLKLEAELKKVNISGLKIDNGKTQFGKRFLALRDLSAKVVFRRHSDDIDRKMNDISNELARYKSGAPTAELHGAWRREEKAHRLAVQQLSKQNIRVAELTARGQALDDDITEKTQQLTTALQTQKREELNSNKPKTVSQNDINKMTRELRQLTKLKSDLKPRIQNAKQQRKLLKTHVREVNSVRKSFRARYEESKCRPAKLAARLEALKIEKNHLRTEVSRNFGINLAELPSHDELQHHFRAARKTVFTEIYQKTRSYKPGLFSRNKGEQAVHNIRSAMSKVNDIADGQKPGAYAVAAQTKLGDGYFVTQAEFDATRSEWADEVKAFDEAQGKNLTKGQKFKRFIIKLFGKKLPHSHVPSYIKTGGKVLAASLKIAKTSQGDMSTTGPLSNVITGAEVTEYFFGSVASAGSAVKNLEAAHSKKEKRQLGKELCEKFDDEQRQIKDPVKRNTQFYQGCVSAFRGHALQSKKVKLDYARVGTSIASSVRYAYKSMHPALIGKLGAAAPIVGGSFAVLGTVASGIDTIIALYETGQAAVDKGTIEKAASNHRDVFLAACAEIGVDVSDFKGRRSNSVDISKARQAILDKGLPERDETALLGELNRLAESEAFVKFMKDETNQGEKATLTAYKAASTVYYGTATALLIGVTATGVVVAGPITAGVATVATGAYYGYKKFKSSGIEYKGKRAADAVLNVADPKLAKKLAKSAAKRGISTDEMAVNLIGRYDKNVKAKDLLSKMRWESRAAMPTQKEVETRARMAGRLEELSDELVKLGEKIESDPELSVGDVNFSALPKNDPRRQFYELGKTAEKLEAQLHSFENHLAQRVVNSSRTAANMTTALKMSSHAVLAMLEADEAHESDAVALIAETLQRYN